ncbi:MAG: hypothetical protein ACPGXY_02610 [Alphaproteobacteria bacterium]
MSHASQAEGLLVSIVGISGSGKSTTFQALSKAMPEATYIREPKSEVWPAWVRKSTAGQITLLLTFRNIWDHNFKLASEAKAAGKMVLLDHYYGGIWQDLIGRPHTEWILDKQNSYFDSFKKIIETDRKAYPIPDILVVTRLDFDTYKSFLSKRGRWLDKDRPYESIYATSAYISEIAEDLKRKYGIKVMYIDQGIKTPEQHAIYIKSEIERLKQAA